MDSYSWLVFSAGTVVFGIGFSIGNTVGYLKGKYDV